MNNKELILFFLNCLYIKVCYIFKFYDWRKKLFIKILFLRVFFSFNCRVIFVRVILLLVCNKFVKNFLINIFKIKIDILFKNLFENIYILNIWIFFSKYI